MATQKLPPFVYQFYPSGYPNYPRIPGGWATLQDEVGAVPARANDSKSDWKQFRYLGIHEVSSALFSFHGEAD